MQRRANILVVDDDTATVDLIVELLCDEGYQVYSASDGNSALAAIAKNPPDLLLLDLNMPQMGGTAIIEHLRNGGSSTIPILLMTASPRNAEALLASDIPVCLAKPFDIDNLIACVARYARPQYNGVEQSSSPTYRRDKHAKMQPYLSRVEWQYIRNNASYLRARSRSLQAASSNLQKDAEQLRARIDQILLRACEVWDKADQLRDEMLYGPLSAE